MTVPLRGLVDLSVRGLPSTEDLCTTGLRVPRHLHLECVGASVHVHILVVCLALGGLRPIVSFEELRLDLGIQGDLALAEAADLGASSALSCEPLNRSFLMFELWGRPLPNDGC